MTICMIEIWILWAFAEGGLRSVNRILSKFVGSAGKTLSGSLLTTIVIGCIQSSGGLIFAISQKKKILLPFREIKGSIFFGLVASAMTVLSIYIFTFKGADVGVNAFIFTLSVIPGTLIDAYFFSHKLIRMQWAGMAVFLVAAYAYLNFPSLDVLLNLPAWIMISLLVALLGSINEALTKVSRKLDPFVNNFWIGLTTIVSCSIAFAFLGSWETIQSLGISFWLGSATIGIVVLAMIMAKLMSYKEGGHIAVKSIVMQSSSLALATFLGVLIYKEPLTAGKIIGIIGFVIAVLLIKKDTMTR
jgi:drug/metabolite transporter (DMT)-like permease